MTFPELLEVGKSCLAIYEPRLNVTGSRPYNEKYVVEVGERREVPLSAATTEEMVQMVGKVLEQLVLKGGIAMSEPRPLRNLRSADEDVVSHNDLNLSFIHGWDNDTEVTSVQCWHYPVA